MKKIWDTKAIQARIMEVLPPGRVVPRHNDDGHFYEVIDGLFTVPPIYPSVTGKLQVLKDESITNFKMNRAIEYFFKNIKNINEENIMEHLDKAAAVSGGILEDAGDIGRRVHDYRELIFKDWLAKGVRPSAFTSFIEPADVDVRAVSALRALQKFVEEKDYIPVAVELLVYSHKWKTAGTLDDLGLMRQVLNEGEGNCDHMNDTLFPDASAERAEAKIIPARASCIINGTNGKHTCARCGYQYRYELVLMDLKTSNQLKDHYFFQVACYWDMFRKILGKEWTPERCIIVKLSKTDGTYKIEDLKRPAKLAQYAGAMITTNEGIDFIKTLRKDNQKVVVTL